MGVFVQCSACQKFFASKRALREHIDKEHRITDAKIRSNKNKGDDAVAT